jgi:serine/threonine protein kinase
MKKRASTATKQVVTATEEYVALKCELRRYFGMKATRGRVYCTHVSLHIIVSSTLILQWQAPEQFTSDYPRTEKADIFSLGYVLNFLLTQEKPFPELSGKETMEHVMKGGIWKVPEKYRQSSHPFNVALSKAVEDCLKFIPEERPSAQHVAHFLRKAREDYKKRQS